MARNVFADDPRDWMNEAAQRALRPAPTDPLSRAEAAGSRTKTPPNVLYALEEAGIGDADSVADRIAASMGGGRSIEDALAELTGDPERAGTVLSRAYDLADARDHHERTKDNSTGGDVARSLAGSALKGAGDALGGLARAGREVSVLGALGVEVPEDGPLGWLARGGVFEAIGGRLSESGRELSEEISLRSADLRAGAVPDGDFFKPGTWEAPENLTMAGAALVAADVFGSLLPVVGAGLVGGPIAGAAVGGLQGAEAGAEQARQVIEAAARDGSLADQSPFYRQRIAAGDTPRKALEATVARAENLGALFTFPVSAFGGAATGAIVKGTLGRAVGGGVARRAATGAAIGGLEEGAQEVAEGVTARAGAGVAAEMPVDLTEGSLADFVLGAIGGAPIGAGGGALSGRSAPAGDAAPAGDEPAPRQLPSPANGGTVIPPSPGQHFMPPDVTTRGTMERPPGSGPLTTALRGAPAAVTEPEPEPLFPDAKPGRELELADEDGVVHRATILGETPQGVRVRIDGDEILLSPREFDASRDRASTQKDAAKSGSRLSQTAKAAVRKPEHAETDLPDTVEATEAAIARILVMGRPENGGIGGLASKRLGELREHRAALLAKPAAASPGNAASEGARGGGGSVSRNFLLGDGPALPTAQPTPATPGSPPVQKDSAPVAAAAAEAEPEPTEAQKEAGNYRKGHARLHGLEITVENAKGSERRGTAPNGTEWSVTMPAHYGYVRGSEGADGDHVDVYVGDDETSDVVLVIDQVDPETGAFDEHKAVLGAKTPQAARQLYIRGFSDGRGKARIGGFRKMDVAEFKDWLKNGDTTKPVAMQDAGEVKPDVVTKPADVVTSEGAKRDLPVSTFQTSKGSTYEVFADGTTRRTKAARNDPGHEGDSGEKSRTARTVYTDDAAAASALSAAGMSNLGRRGARLAIRNGKASLLTWNEAAGKWGAAPSSREIPIHTESQPGRAPLELWSPADDAPGYEAYRRMHAGNVIVGDTQAEPKPRPAATPMKPATERQQPDMLGAAPKGEEELAAKERSRRTWGRMAGMIRGDRVADINEEVDGFVVRGSGAKRLRVALPDGKVISNITVKSPDQALEEIRRRIRNAKEDFGTQEGAAPAKEGAAPTSPRPDWQNPFPELNERGDGPAERKAPAEPKAAAKPAGKAAERPFPDFTGREIDGRDDNTSEDGRNSPIKKEFHAAAVALLRATEKILRDMGWTEAKARHGKAIKPVSSNFGGAAGSGEISLTLLGPDGARGAYVQISAAFSGKGVRMLHRIMQAGNPYGSGSNEFADPTGMTPVQLAAKLVDMHARVMNHESAARLRKEAEAAAPSQPAAPDVTPTPEPERTVPAGHMLGSIKKMTKPEAERSVGDPDALGKEWKAGDFHAVVSRHNPYAIFGGYGKTRAEAVNDAIARAERSPAPTSQAKGADVTPAPVVDKAPPASDPVAEPAAQPKATYGSKNKLVTEDRRAELAARLKAKLASEIRSGIDPEILAIGAELAVFHIEAGARRFVDVIGAVAADLGTTPDKLTRFARAWYNGARDMLEDSGENVDDMDDAAAVREALAVLKAGTDSPTGASTETAPSGTLEPQEDDDAGAAVRRGDPEALEAALPGDVPGVRGSGDAGSRSSEAEPEGGRPGGEPDEVRTPAARGGRARSGSPVSGTRRVRSRAAVEPEPETVKAARASVPAIDFKITDDLRLGQGSEGEKYADNIAAIRALKQIEAENRRATADEQRVLARYVGWGGLKAAFRVAGASEGEGIRKGWEARVAELEDLLEPAELRAARNSTKAAHYTSQTIVNAIWRGVERLGFSGGAVLEPSAGAGNFLGLMPDSLRGKSRALAVEYDSITARIAKHLYPNAEVLHAGFQSVPLPQNAFALAIGNPPFGSESLYFQHQPEANGHSIHNQFFIASLAAVEPGGIMAMVVSHYLMDAKDGSARRKLAAMGDLVAGIRLPSNAFLENARTEVVTDILFFRRRAEVDQAVLNLAIAAAAAGTPATSTKLTEEEVAQAQRLADGLAGWLGSDTIPDPAGSGAEINVNRYFRSKPRQIIGRLDATSTMHGRGGLNVTLDDPASLPERLDALIAALPQDTARDEVAERTLAMFDGLAQAMRLSVAGVEPGAVRVDEDGALRLALDVADPNARNMLAEIELTADTPYSKKYTYRRDGKWQFETDVLDEKGKPVKQRKDDGTLSKLNVKTIEVVEDPASLPAPSKWGKARLQMLRDMLPVRDALKRQLQLEAGDATASQIERGRKRLNAVYDAYAAAHGSLHGGRGEEIAALMPDGGLILATETVDKKGGVAKAPIMAARVMHPPKMAETAASPADAVALSLAERGGIDLDRIAALLGTDEAGAIAAISKGEKPLAFLDPESGRWESADGYLSGLVRKKLRAAQDAGLEANVKALEASQPEAWDSSQITPTLGSNWIPAAVYRDFLQHLGFGRAFVHYSEATNSYSVEVDGRPAEQWRTEGRAMNANEIVGALLNSRPIKVTFTDREGKTHVDEEATEESRQKAAEVTSEFLDWVFADDARRTALTDLFNERFNGRVLRQRDGSHLTLPGKTPAITMRRHQSNAIWRGITDRVVLYDHVVGAGKTYTAIARIMERRRMGLSRRPLVVVPNHLIEQWRKDVLKLYPGAKVLAAGAKDFERGNRRRLFARIAAGDFDMAIIGHSSFGFISIDPATETRYLEEELRNAQEAVAEAAEAAAEAGIDNGRKPFTVAEAERLVTKIETRLAKLRAGTRDRLLTFDEMGIDDLTIDEAHEFKNLSYSSRLVGVAGMGNKNGSAKAMDLHLKVRSLHDRPGTAIAFLTGTPISNSVSEMYLLLRNLAPNELRDLGMTHFDAWRSMFVSYATAFEPTEAGGIKEVTRLGREWDNMRALMDLYYSVADCVPIEDIKAMHQEDTGRPFPVPMTRAQRAGKGDREMVAVAPDVTQAEILGGVVAGFNGLRDISDPKERNAARLRLMDRARKVALDARAVDPNIDVPPGTGKIGAVVDGVARIHRQTAADRGTQLVFLDRSVPKAKGDEEFVARFDGWIEKLNDARAADDDKAEQRALEALEAFDPQDVEARRSAMNGGWNAYDEIRRQLVAKGVPADEIRFVQEANSDAEKKALFDAVNEGAVRVLIGSTPRMGAGTNVQERLVALHHVDVTWKPSDIEQREGRIIRQGNALLEKHGHDGFTVDVIAYATERTVDAKMWSLNATKLKAINGIRKYDGSFNMEFEDEESASMAEMAALATGDPLMIERVVLEADRQKLDLSRRTFNRKRNGQRARLGEIEETIARADGRVETLRKFKALLDAAVPGIKTRSEARSITIEGKTYRSALRAEEAARAAIEAQRGDDLKARFKIEIDGNAVTSIDAMQGEITRAFGVPDFEATFGDETTITHWRTARLIAEALTAKIAAKPETESHTLDGITVMGLPVEVDFFRDTFDSGDARTMMFSVIIDGASAWDYRQRIPGGKPNAPAAAAVLERIVGVAESDFDARIRQIERDKAMAEKDKPAVAAELEKSWPKQEEYDQKTERLKEVIAILSGKESASPTPAADEAPAGAKERRGDLTPKAPPASRARADAARQSLVRRLEQLGIADAVALRFAEQFFAADGSRLDGWQLGNVIGLSLSGAAERTLDHEAIHLLRDPEVWGRPYGLFTREEWRALVRAARADTALMARVREAYPDLSGAALVEEAVAEIFADFAAGGRVPAVARGALAKIAAFFDAIAAALRGAGLTSVEEVFAAIGRGDVGRRRDAATGRFAAAPGGQPVRARRAALATGTAQWAKDGDAYVSDLMTTAMAGRPGLLSLVPGRPLFSELGKRLAGARTYLSLKEGMDALRNDWHARADGVAQSWMGLMQGVDDDATFVSRIYGETIGRFSPAVKAKAAAARKANEALMDLMHDATLRGIDPSKRWSEVQNRLYLNEAQKGRPGLEEGVLEERQAAYGDLRARYDALPAPMREIFKRVAADYDRMGDEFEAAVIENVRNAMRIGLSRAERAHRKEMARITDEGLEGAELEEATAAANEKLAAAQKRAGWGLRSRLAALRKQFEANRLQGPYFPLARFGTFWVTLRDGDGKVVSFSRFESRRKQRQFAEEKQREGLYKVQTGVLSETDGTLKDQVDPTFVASVIGILEDAGADNAALDAVWQRWLETLPDQSIRTSRIHRKGREGYAKDALRAYADHLFHGAHQLARLRYGLLMEEALDIADEEAAKDADPQRTGLVVNEMRKRHAFTMNPSGGQAATMLTSLGFVWYLGATPAAAIVNLSQTTVIGVPMLAAGFQKASVGRVIRELGRAGRDFAKGKGEARRSEGLAPEEREAMREAYRRGVADKTQGHDLAGINETGVSYDPTRQRWMRRVSWFFHQAERANREVTFLAAYRLARHDGLGYAESIDRAADMTWKIHFDYQNTSRPRIMQNDTAKVLLLFRQYTVSMLWRLFRDSHQALHGASPAERREARAQLIGVTLSMLAHAGITGTWGYGIITMLLGLFFPGGADDVEDWLHDALLMEGDSAGTAAWNYAMGAALNGVPGQVTGISLTERIGMPNLWFRGPDRALEGSDLYNYWMGELLGPIGGIGESWFRGAQYLGEGDWWRATEAFTPKVARDVLRAGRYAGEGVTTRKGDLIVEDVNLYQLLAQASGFTPAQIAERYEANGKMKNKEARLEGERSEIQAKIRNRMIEGKPPTEAMLRDLRDWNRAHPEYPITGESLRASMRSRQRMSQRTTFGIELNPRLEERIRSEAPPLIYG